MKVEYKEASLDNILARHARSYVLPSGCSLYGHEAIVDQHGRKVVFKLLIEEPGQPVLAQPCDGGFWEASVSRIGEVSEGVCTICKRPQRVHP